MRIPPETSKQAGMRTILLRSGRLVVANRLSQIEEVRLYSKLQISKILPIALAFAMLLGACSSPTETPAPGGPTEAALPTEPEAGPTQAGEPAVPEQPKDAYDKVTITFTQQFDTFNPLYVNTWFASLNHQIWNCWAWDFDDQNSPRPVLVSEIPSTDNGGISGDGRVITMRLRDDIRWSDGTPITAQDFAFTYQMRVSPQNSTAARRPYDLITSLETPDERTVVVTFAQPLASWVSTLWQGLLPAHILTPVFESQGTLDNAAWNTAPTVGCGPYIFAEWTPGQSVRFLSNENYWLGKPKIDEITILYVADEAAQMEALRSDQADLGTFIAYPDAPGLESAGIKIQKVFSGFNEGWFFYLSPQDGHPALQDVRVRQAIALAFDRFGLNQSVLNNLTVPAISYWDNTPYLNPALSAWPYDPERAKQLLDEAGWVDTNENGIRDKDGVELSLTYGTVTRDVRQTTQALALEQLAQVGIALETFAIPEEIFFSSFGAGGPAATGQLDIFQYSARSDFPDPDTADFLCSEIPSEGYPNGVNWSAVCDQELDALFQQQASLADVGQRQAIFHQISQIVFDRVYFLGLWQDSDLWAIGPRLQNVRLSGVTPFFNIAEWETAQ